MLAQQMAPKLPAREGAGGTPDQTGSAPLGGQTTESSRTMENAPPSAGGGGLFQFLPILLIMGLFVFILMGGQRKEKKRRAKLLAALRKGNKVQTVGGILGTVVELRETEVVLKVDENTNTRIKFGRSSVQSIISESQEAS
jgi:preprotein translocase subunit YajC